MPINTYDVSANADDGWVRRTGTTYPPTSTGPLTVSVQSPDTQYFEIATARHLNAPNDFHTVVALCRWDTSNLGAVNITDAYIRLWMTNRRDTDGRNFQGEYYASSNWPINSADWTSTPASSAFSVTVASITPYNDTAYFDITLLSPNANINKTGYTGIRFHIDGGEPTGLNDAIWRAADLASGRPKLVVTYNTYKPAQGQLLFF